MTKWIHHMKKNVESFPVEKPERFPSRMDAGEKSEVITWMFSRTVQQNRKNTYFFKNI